jgi:hypothetical protein
VAGGGKGLSLMSRPCLLITAAASLCASVLIVIPSAAGAADAPGAAATRVKPPAVTTLQPGRQVTFNQRIPVNVVLVGYDPAQVASGIRAALPREAEPEVIIPKVYYGLNGRDLGLKYRYDYRIVDAPKAFEDHFFDHVTRTARTGPLTDYQQQYNDQKTNVLNVKGPVLHVDAAATERYLEGQARSSLGLSPDSGYTVFLVNWWGRKDFRFHVFHKRGGADPDTGRDFDTLDSRALIAWGGTSGRSWMYDLSAGPEFWTDSWNVDDADLDGNGEPDYRMPPVWEYAAKGNRKPSALGPDLGKVVRYVATDLLFTTSPLYDPLTLTPEPGGKIRVPITMFEQDPSVDASRRIKPQLARRAWQDLKPYQTFTTELKDVDPIDQGAAKSLAIWAGLSTRPGCWEPYGDPFAQLFCYFDQHRRTYLPRAGDDYIEPVFAFNTTDAAMGDQLGLLGYADDNWVDGTPSFVYQFDSPDNYDAGYGFTSTTTHEVGHHLGLSHPHDGYDPETGVTIDALDAFYFAWSGDESDTTMAYTQLSNGFSVFDKDNTSRLNFAGYLNWANALLGEIDRRDLTSAQTRQVEQADRLAKQATSAFAGWRYESAAAAAYDAWELVQKVASSQGIELDPITPTPAQLQKLGPLPRHPEPDPVRSPDN